MEGSAVATTARVGGAPTPGKDTEQDKNKIVSPCGAKEPHIIAGKEVVGREIVVWSGKVMEWVKARIVQYEPETNKHLIQFSSWSLKKDSSSNKSSSNGNEPDLEGKWLQLARTRFQWTSKPPANAEPNPTFVSAPRAQEAVGYRVKVFWPGMAKWYQGKVEGYDAASKCHTVKYRDGDIQTVNLRHEAVMYLEKMSGAMNGATGSAKKSHGSAKKVKGDKVTKTPQRAAVQEKVHRKQRSSGGVTKRKSAAKRKNTASAKPSSAKPSHRARGGGGAAKRGLRIKREDSEAGTGSESLQGSPSSTDSTDSDSSGSQPTPSNSNSESTCNSDSQEAVGRGGPNNNPNNGLKKTNKKTVRRVQTTQRSKLKRKGSSSSKKKEVVANKTTAAKKGRSLKRKESSSLPKSDKKRKTFKEAGLKSRKRSSVHYKNQNTVKNSTKNKSVLNKNGGDGNLEGSQAVPTSDSGTSQSDGYSNSNSNSNSSDDSINSSHESSDGGGIGDATGLRPDMKNHDRKTRRKRRRVGPVNTSKSAATAAALYKRRRHGDLISKSLVATLNRNDASNGRDGAYSPGDDERIRMAGAAVVGSRVALIGGLGGKRERSKNHSFTPCYKGKLCQFDSYHKRHKVLYDDGEEEWVALPKETFRCLLPRAASAENTASMKSAMTILGALLCNAEGVSGRENDGKKNEESVKDPQPTNAAGTGVVVEKAPSISEEAEGWHIRIRALMDGKMYGAEVLRFNANTNKHHLLYEDGEDEWVNLKEEEIEWVGLVPEGRPNVCPGVVQDVLGTYQVPGRKPEGKAAVGWRVGVFWPGDGAFFTGEVTGYDESSGKHEVAYDDGERGTMTLGLDKVKWILPPGIAVDQEGLERIGGGFGNGRGRRRVTVNPTAGESDPDYEVDPEEGGDVKVGVGVGGRKYQGEGFKVVERIKWRGRRGRGRVAGGGGRLHSKFVKTSVVHQEVPLLLDGCEGVPVLVGHVLRVTSFGGAGERDVHLPAAVPVRIYLPPTEDSKDSGKPLPATGKGEKSVDDKGNNGDAMDEMERHANAYSKIKEKEIERDDKDGADEAMEISDAAFQEESVLKSRLATLDLMARRVGQAHSVLSKGVPSQLPSHAFPIIPLISRKDQSERLPSVGHMLRQGPSPSQGKDLCEGVVQQPGHRPPHTGMVSPFSMPRSAVRRLQEEDDEGDEGFEMDEEEGDSSSGSDDNQGPEEDGMGGDDDDGENSNENRGDNSSDNSNENRSENSGGGISDIGEEATVGGREQGMGNGDGDGDGDFGLSPRSPSFARGAKVKPPFSGLHNKEGMEGIETRKDEDSTYLRKPEPEPELEQEHDQGKVPFDVVGGVDQGGHEAELKADSLVNLLELGLTSSTGGLIFSTHGPSLDDESELGGTAGVRGDSEMHGPL